MFIVLLRFAGNRGQAGRFLDGHKAWLQRGFDDGVFLVAGSLRPDLGGAILAYGTSLADLQVRVSEDPFVAEGVVSAEVLDVVPARAQERLRFLLA